MQLTPIIRSVFPNVALDECDSFLDGIDWGGARELVMSCVMHVVCVSVCVSGGGNQ